MTRYVTIDEVLDYQRVMIDAAGGGHGIRDMNAADSAVAQPRQSVVGEDLYPSVAEKAAAPGYSLIANHGFVDGNKRTGYAGMRTFLFLNGYQLTGTTDEKEVAVLAAAAGTMDRSELTRWVADHLEPLRDLPVG
jgi:death-on-curing protein